MQFYFTKKVLEIEDLGKEKQHDVMLSTDNQTILWSPCDFDQADKSCFKVGPGIYMPSGFVGCNVTFSTLSNLNIYRLDILQIRKLNFWPHAIFSTMLTFWYIVVIWTLMALNFTRRLFDFILASQQPSVGCLGNQVVAKGVVSHKKLTSIHTLYSATICFMQICWIGIVFLASLFTSFWPIYYQVIIIYYLFSILC